MGRKISGNSFTFDDVLIRPSRSSIEPREASLRAVIASGLTLSNPFLSAAMDRVTEHEMAIALYKAGGLGILHRNCSSAFQIEMVHKVKRAGAKVGAACGPFDLDMALALGKAKIDLLVIDCAHGHNLKVIQSARLIKKRLGNLPVMVGNIATAEAVRDLSGIADIVKVGVGPGSICTTRVVSGVGVPQLSAILEVAKEAQRRGIKVVADGGIRTSGDIAKALAAGADAVMLGNIFAGTKESPGEMVILNGKKYKEYRGMGSKEVLDERNSADRYLIEGRKAVPEGISGLVSYRGSILDMVPELSSGVQVAMGYVGAKNIQEFHKKSQFILITHASIQEGSPHSLDIYNGISKA